MAQRTELAVSSRTVMGKAAKRLRQQGIIPANIYGHKKEPVAVQLDAVAFDRLRRSHSTRNVLSLRVDGSPAQTALIRHVQIDPLTDKVLHIDFARVNLSEAITSKVPLNYIGEAPGVKIQGGLLLHLLEALEVECRVSNLVEHLDVDVSVLEAIDSTLHAKDIKLPTNYKLVTDPEEPVAKIAAPRRVEAEVPEVAVAPAAEAPAAPAEQPTETPAAE